MKEINASVSDSTAINNGVTTMENLGKSIASISTIITSLNESNTTISSLLEGSGNSNLSDPRRLEIKLAKLFELITVIMGDGEKGIIKFANDLNTNLETFPNTNLIVPKIEGILNIITNITPIIGELKKISEMGSVLTAFSADSGVGLELSNIFKPQGNIDILLDNLSKMSTIYTPESLEGITEWATSLKTTLRGVFSALSEAKDVISEIQLASNMISQAMQGNNEHSINIGGKFEIKVKVEVSMDAKELASNMRVALDEEGFVIAHRPGVGH